MKEIKDFYRNETFQRYNSMQNPFIIMNTTINVTNVVKYAKEHKHFYATLGYLIGAAVNDTKAFRYRYIDNKYYICDKVGVSYTERLNDNVYFLDCYKDSLEEHIKEYDEQQKLVYTSSKSVSKERNDVIWVSCVPWFNFNSLITPYDKNITIPQFIWDKYTEKDGEYYCNLMIMIHHGFADGYHIYEFINSLEEHISKLN